MTPTRFRNRHQGDLSPDELSYRISTFGFRSAERELEQFARRLMAAGELPNLTAVMLDRDAPSIIRERAFARAAVRLRNSPLPLFHVA